MKKFALLVLLVPAACSGMSPTQKQAAITLVVQQGATLASALGGPKAAGWIAAGGLVCHVGNSYIAGLGLNVQGTLAADMQAACDGLGGSGATLPPGVDPASVLVAVLQH